MTQNERGTLSMVSLDFIVMLIVRSRLSKSFESDALLSDNETALLEYVAFSRRSMVILRRIYALR